MGRRYLSFTCALVVLVSVLATPAAAALPWRLLVRGPAVGSADSQTEGYVAVNRAGLASFSARLPDKAQEKAAAVDFRHAALVAIFGEFGCQDSLIDVASIVQQGKALAIRLVQHPPPAGTATCMAIFPTYRLLTVAKTALRQPYPTRATVTLART